MGSYTGTCHPLSVGDSMGDSYPLINAFLRNVAPGRTTKRKVFGFRLVGTSAAISTDEYTYTLHVTNRARILLGAYIIDPIGLSVDATNYNTFAVKKTGAVTMCSMTTAYGLAANELHEITRANTLANRTLAATNTVTLVITGTVAGRIINPNTLVFLVFDDA